MDSPFRPYANVYEAVVSQFAPEVRDRMHTVHNGFDWKFPLRAADKIYEVIPAEIADHPVLLFPHRPDINKGIYEVVQVARRLVRDMGWDDLRVLVPRWLDADSDPLNRAYYDKLRRTINDAGLAKSSSFTIGSAKRSYRNIIPWLT